MYSKCNVVFTEGKFCRSIPRCVVKREGLTFEGRGMSLEGRAKVQGSRRNTLFTIRILAGDEGNELLIYRNGALAGYLSNLTDRLRVIDRCTVPSITNISRIEYTLFRGFVASQFHAWFNIAAKSNGFVLSV
jgi:hypothetical protein